MVNYYLLIITTVLSSFAFKIDFSIIYFHFSDIKEHLVFIEKSVTSKEPRFTLRVVRSLVSIRKRLNAKILRKVVAHFYVHSTPQRDSLLAFIDEVSFILKCRNY